MTAMAAARPWIVRGLTLAFFAVLAWFGLRYAQTIAWQEVGSTLAATPGRVLGAAAALAVASHTLYSCFDLIGRRYTGHALRPLQVMRATFISYAFNLNLGSLVGGIALRLRMYSRLGLAYLTITRVFALSIATNWLGYLVLAGLVLSMAPPEPPPEWNIGTRGLRLLGPLLLALALAYLALCAGWSRRRLRVRRVAFRLPSGPMALVQLALSCANWATMAALLFVLFEGSLPYLDVLGVLLVAAIAGVLFHVPAGLGVLEAVFMALLSHRVPETRLLAVLLTYRAVYYLAPLALAAVLYLMLEAQRGRAS